MHSEMNLLEVFDEHEKNKVFELNKSYTFFICSQCAIFDLIKIKSACFMRKLPDAPIHWKMSIDKLSFGMYSSDSLNRE